MQCSIQGYRRTSQIFMRTSYYFAQNSIAYVHCTIVNHKPSWQYSCLYRLVHMFVYYDIVVIMNSMHAFLCHRNIKPFK